MRIANYRVSQHLVKDRLPTYGIDSDIVSETIAHGVHVPSRPTSDNSNWRNCSTYSAQFSGLLRKGHRYVTVVVDRVDRFIITAYTDPLPY